MALTAKEKLFCEAYLSNGYNAKEAYIEAGYKAVDFARQEGYRLTTKPYIRKYLDEAIDALIGDRRGMTQQVLQEIKRYVFMTPQQMELEQVRPSDKKGFVELFGKYLKMFNEQKEITHTTIDEKGNKKGIDYSQISTEALKEIVKASTD